MVDELWQPINAKRTVLKLFCKSTKCERNRDFKIPGA